MRRSVPAVIITLVGLGALASFKSAPATPTKSLSAAIKTPATSAAPPATAPPATTPATAPATSPVTGATTPRTSPATSPPATAPPAPATTRTIDGNPVDNQYGTVQVRVTLRGNHITDVQALQMPFDHQQSADISQQAEPLLRQEVLQAQSAQIDLLSGATFTSDSYAQSLQSALDKAHA